MRGYGDHLQYSVFECQFTPSKEELVRKVGAADDLGQDDRGQSFGVHPMSETEKE